MPDKILEKDIIPNGKHGRHSLHRGNPLFLSLAERLEFHWHEKERHSGRHPERKQSKILGGCLTSLLVVAIRDKKVVGLLLVLDLLLYC